MSSSLIQSLPQETQTLTPLAPFRGVKPPAPEWFHRALACVPEEHHVWVDGARIHYLEWGDRTHPGLILVHGNAAHAHWWSFIAPLLAEKYHVVALDLAGMGDSGWRDSYKMVQFVHDEMAVATDCGMFAARVPPVIVAHSFGGYVTVLAGALYGDKLGGTVLIDAPVNPGGRPRPDRPVHKSRKIYGSQEEALARFRLVPTQECENLYLLDHIARHSLKEADGGWCWKFDPNIWRDFSIGDQSARLKGTRCRIAVFRGEHSTLLPPDVGNYMSSLLGHAAPVVEIPASSHHIMLDQPIALVSALRALLADWRHSVPHRKIPSRHHKSTIT